MTHLLNLFAAIALLVWGTHLVRTGILRVFGANLRSILAHSTSNRLAAAVSGIGVTAVVQSSTATALIVSAFVGQGLMNLTSALAVMLGADIGTSLMAVVFSRDLSWLSPLFIFVGVVLFIARQSTTIGRVGRVLIGLGLMLLALRLVTQSANVLTQSIAVKALLSTLTSDMLLEILVGATLALVSYSSLAIVLLTATLATSGVVPVDVALGLVLGANLGSGALAVLTTLNANIETRQVPLGNLVFKVLACWRLCHSRDSGSCMPGPTCKTLPPGGGVSPGLQPGRGRCLHWHHPDRGALGGALAAQTPKNHRGRPPTASGPVRAGHTVFGHLLRGA